jgi:restriction system protein
VTYAEAAIKVLADADKPLHYKEITDRALANGYCTTNAKTPDQSLYTAIAYQMGRGDKSDFVKVSPGVFGLREWKESSSEIAESIEETEYKIRVPHYPAYEEVRRLLPILDGLQASEFTGMQSEIFGLTGTPQDPMDWSDPDVWIAKRLTAATQALAQRVWLESDKMVNPRHSQGHWLLARRYELVQIDADGSIKISQRGRDFIENETGTAVVYLDEQEGVLELLSLIAASGPGSKADFIDDWAEYVRKVANYQSDASIPLVIG